MGIQYAFALCPRFTDIDLNALVTKGRPDLVGVELGEDDLTIPRDPDRRIIICDPIAVPQRNNYVLIDTPGGIRAELYRAPYRLVGAAPGIVAASGAIIGVVRATIGMFEV